MMMVWPNIFEASLGRQSHIWASIFTQNTNDVDMNYEIFFKEIFDREGKEGKKGIAQSSKSEQSQISSSPKRLT